MTSLQKYEWLVSEAKKTYEERLEKYKKELTAAQKSCPHPQEKLKYYPDPSGNNDSSYECKLCGLEKRRAWEFTQK